ncbi:MULTISPECIES: FxsB family cyclophane-forming radical SAM/SPASM peptide maturase [Streptomyces]|uniref:FxsB family cyclophane-forming radical SAM/SPASM peptide maturase n=1 Tax=Streptomyces TaxID=1883 RepID=UPI00292D23FD|nr:FxsB family cyclophane-forming radical SAM/SPASM peptide maturase [Streptomyces sp. NEAU-HV9]
MRKLPLVSRTSASAEWPTTAVTNEALSDAQWHPLPFTEFVVKVHSRCNLACDYCYVYEMSDSTWKTQEKTMSRATVDQAATRIAEHVRAHRGEIPEVKVVLHGGEPLLAGTELIEYMVTKFRNEVPADVGIDFRITTNGTLLDRANLEMLRLSDIKVYVSLDGSQQDNDRHRKYADGRGSFSAVVRGINALREPSYAELFAGMLCTVNVENDPVETYETLVSFGSPMIDFLLPHGNWTQPPPHWGGSSRGETPYADWLIPIFDRWYGASSKPTSVRFFDEILALILGGHSRLETVGLAPNRTVIIDTSGSIDLDHQLKSVHSGAHLTGSHIERDPFDSLILHPGVVARQRGVAALCEACLRCPIRDVCGGGQYVHRYKKGTGYLNPSAYCADLTRLITHVHERVLADLSSALRQEAGSV